MPTIKIKIARFLIISGFLLNIGNYSLGLLDFYSGDLTSITHAIDDTEEKSESNEKDGSEKEDLKEKDKISQYSDDKHTGLSYYSIKYYPDLIYQNSSVYLDYTTPPPENS
ncbi:hypothetical protein SAMN04487910_0959 [Aquimarina amphilecti]|uniref:Uncharacterized protein n=1 Tax=Aquimarina amphilecti TaxID=1038014 RepID=A0A1H7JFM5_AQUAM|nr:hypothetical protein [Aquimarina amphilecti]SEK72707.1 hypothetical protein SAMN04487910_0959 [Aquimarina amphilecti]